MRASWWAAMMVVALGGCGGDAAVPAGPVVTGTEEGTETVSLGEGYGLFLPKSLAGFAREDTALGHGAPGAVAGYAHPEAPGPVMATIHAHAFDAGNTLLGGGSGRDATGENSDAALLASIREARRFYPDMVVSPRSDVFIVRFGAGQRGRTATLRFTDLFAGTRQPIAMRIETYCCLGGRWDYEYRFRTAAGSDVTALEHRFASGIAWSRDPAGSVDRPE